MTAMEFRLRRIPFHAPARSGPLSWAQRAIRACIEWLGEDSYYFNIPAVIEVPAGMTEDQVACALAALVERHEVLRTRFTDHDGHPRQIVSGNGTLALRVVESTVLGSRDAADNVAAALWWHPFDHETDWPFRCALTMAGNQPRFLAVVLSHMAVDGAGREMFIEEVRAALAVAAVSGSRARTNGAGSRSGPGGEAANGGARAVDGHGAVDGHAGMDGHAAVDGHAAIDGRVAVEGPAAMEGHVAMSRPASPDGHGTLAVPIAADGHGAPDGHRALDGHAAVDGHAATDGRADGAAVPAGAVTGVAGGPDADCPVHVPRADGQAALPSRLSRPAWQPIDQALSEEGPAGIRANARAAKHWRSELAKVPPMLFQPTGQPPAEPRIWRVGMTSQAAAVALCMLVQDLGTSPATLMMAATAGLLGAVTGAGQVPLQLIVGNRFDMRSQGCLSVMAQDGLMTLPVAGASFREIVGRAEEVSVKAYLAGHYDPATIKDLRAQAARDRGLEKIDISAYFNDVPYPGDWEETVLRGLREDEVVSLLSSTELADISAWPRQDSTLFIHSLYSAGVSVVHAVTDTAVFPLSVARAFLRGMERIIVRAAFHEVSAEEIAETGALVRDGARVLVTVG